MLIDGEQPLKHDINESELTTGVFLMRFLIKGGLLVATLMACFTVEADRAMLRKPNVKQFVRSMVQQDHFDRRQLTAILSEARFQPQIIESMDKPFEKKNWDIYKNLFLTEQRVREGVEFWKINQNTLAQAEKQYGVPADLIVAIIGVETLYGKHQGNYRVLDALSTLAFYYPKRSEYFTKELREFLLLCREQHVSATQFTGSYAGAMGKPQFMPSSYRFYAVDAQKRGRANLMTEDSDVIHSVANYFAKHGWRDHDQVAEPMRLGPVSAQQLSVNSKTPNYSFVDLLAMGVRPEVSAMHHPKEAGVIELMTASGPEYWLAYPNFYVITKYNTSPQYALVVYLLSQELRQQRLHAQQG